MIGWNHKHYTIKKYNGLRSMFGMIKMVKMHRQSVHERHEKLCRTRIENVFSMELSHPPECASDSSDIVFT